MNYGQSIRYLFTLGRELGSPQSARAAKFDLAKIAALTERLGRPQNPFPSVHIAGTNGKGSTAAMLASIMLAAGLRVGLYTSPHLVRINERIRLNDQEISDPDFAEAFTRIHAAVEQLLAEGILLVHPSYFECLTAMAFDFFARQNVDMAVIEVGMGGRLDATNVIVPQVAVITQIDFDHENYLGHSIPQIAAEKAGIIKPGARVVSAATHPEAQAVIRRRAAEQRATLVELDSAWEAVDPRAQDGCYRFVAKATASAREASGGPTADMPIALSLPGRFQIRNALAAIAAARLLASRGFAIDEQAIVRGLAAVRWPGRLERLWQSPAVYLDGTHNPGGARELVAFWDEHLAGCRIHLIYGAVRDKAVDEVAGLLFPRAATVLLTQSRQPRALSAGTLAAMTAHLASKVEVIANPAAALDRALAIARPDDVIVVTGSLYLVGDVRPHWDALMANRRYPVTQRPAHSF